MRIQRIVARAFGPFGGSTLDLAPGMTVVAGPNESGKSSWHAALRLAITGVRRGKGPGTAAERALAERHKPWDQPDRWEVEARLALDDGRIIDITQDLASKVACRAIDVALGRDVSDEILDGTPDASRWLGLDRDSFASTVSVSQAQIMAVAGAAEELQEQMQRAAATHGADATAAEAIARLEQFRRDAVGADTVAAKGPLRTAKNRLAAAVAARDHATVAHADFLERAAQVDAAERAAHAARLRLAGAEAAAARMQAAEAAARAARAAELASRHPEPPATLAAGDELAARAAAAVDGYRNRPAPIELAGPTSAQIEAELAALPTAPAGDLRPHPTVVEAHRALALAGEAVRLIGDRPVQVPDPGTGWDAAALRDLAARLALPELPEAADLEAELAQLRRRHDRGVPALATFGGAALSLAVAAGLMLAGSAPFAAAAATLGAVLLIAGFVGVRGRQAAVETMRQAEASVDPYRRNRHAAEATRAAAVLQAQEAGLPQDPAALHALADRVAEAALQEEAAAKWDARRQESEAQRAAAHGSLLAALRERGEDLADDDDPAAAADAYVAACERRAEQARQADRAQGLRAQLEARLATEGAAAAARLRADQAATALRAVAQELGLSGADDDQLCAAVTQWRTERADALRDSQQALAEWQQLQGLLDGGSLADLEADAARRRQRATELATGLPPDAVTLPMGVDVEEHLATLRHEAQRSEREHDLARGSLDAMRSALPDVAEAEEASESARRELERVQRQAATIDTTLGLLRAAQERVHRDLAPVLARAVERWLPVVSRGAYHEVSVDPASLRVIVKEAASGQWRDARLLSEGTREQIYLLLRVAMAEHLVVTGEHAPLILDEVTAQCDGERKRELLDVLHAVSAERQVILFTHDDEVATWAEAALVEPQDALVRLPRRSRATAAVPVEATREDETPLVPLTVD